MVGERILWFGQPVRKIILTGDDWFVSMFVVVSAVFAALIAIDLLRAPGSFPFDFFMLGWAAFVVVYTTYMALGRFLVRNGWKGRTYFALTDRRAISLTLGRRRAVRAAWLSSTGTVAKEIRRDGIGTIRFGPPAKRIPMIFAMLQSPGMAAVPWKEMAEPVLVDIQDADAVDRLARSIRDEAPRGASAPPSPPPPG